MTSRSTKPEIWEDTRNKQGKHAVKNAWWAAHGIEVVRRKLDAGDYGREGSNVFIDTKQDVQELAGNCGREHARFARELDRARDAGCRLYILVEEHAAYNDRANLRRWVCRTCRMCPEFRAGACDPNADACRARRLKPMNGAVLAKIIKRLEEDHGARFAFCDRRDSARTICDLLGVRFKG